MDPWARVRDADHAVLGTVNVDRGVDLVPVVFVVDGSSVWIPIDTVKRKSGGRLGRERNLTHDPRCSLLVEHYDADWRSLWWVRLHGTGHLRTPEDRPEAIDLLAAKYPRYRGGGTIARLIGVDVESVSSWSAR